MMVSVRDVVNLPVNITQERRDGNDETPVECGAIVPLNSAPD
jgi:hypothetical protein